MRRLFHRIHTDDAVECVSEIYLLQDLLFSSHIREFGPGLQQHLLGLIYAGDGSTALQDQRPVLACATGGIQDRASRRAESEKTLQKRLMRGVNMAQFWS